MAKMCPRRVRERRASRPVGWSNSRQPKERDAPAAGAEQHPVAVLSKPRPTGCWPVITLVLVGALTWLCPLRCTGNCSTLGYRPGRPSQRLLANLLCPGGASSAQWQGRSPPLPAYLGWFSIRLTYVALRRVPIADRVPCALQPMGPQTDLAQCYPAAERSL